MGRRAKQPNRQLAELFEETGASRKGLARRAVERGKAIGVDLGLEFSLSLAEATAAAIALWRSDVERRRFLMDASYAVAVYPAASMRWLTMPGPEHPVSSGYRRIGQDDVDAVRTMTTAFRNLDNQVGGGKVRPTIVHYLHSSVAPLLHGSYNESIGRQLFAATPELTKLAGWAAYDLEERGLAQRYFIQALRMARAASDAGLAGEILAAMSHQATYVGRSGDAIDLACAARIAARTAGLAALESECHLLERTDTPPAPPGRRACGRADTTCPAWLAYFDDAYMSAKTAHCFRDLGDYTQAAEFAEQSLNMSDGYLWGRTFNLCLPASSRADEDPREAVRIGFEALDLAVGLESRRSFSYLRQIRHRLAPYSEMGDVAEFRRRVFAITARADRALGIGRPLLLRRRSHRGRSCRLRRGSESIECPRLH
ncbi:hypothetical protein [Nocardia brevicatena]|uniref:hypothetical protein n=1 Tax=Nocardia brevicatena TaxID=37327 RepID=UPI001FE22410|nr:hypothetical protein [Nocardia brevicatena]